MTLRDELKNWVGSKLLKIGFRILATVEEDGDGSCDADILPAKMTPAGEDMKRITPKRAKTVLVSDPPLKGSVRERTMRARQRGTVAR